MEKAEEKSEGGGGELETQEGAVIIFQLAWVDILTLTTALLIPQDYP